MPNRPMDQDVRFPAVGGGTMEWKGLLPFSHNPRVLNPEQGYLASWNNQIAPGLRADSANFSHVDRVNEILSELKVKEQFWEEDLWDIGKKIAFKDLNARYFVKELIEVGRLESSSNLASHAAEMVEQWDWNAVDDDNDGYYDAAGLTVYRAWLDRLFELTFKDDLPESVFAQYSSLGYPAPTSGSARPGAAVKLLWNAYSSDGGVTQKFDFLNGESKLKLMQTALEDSAQQLANEKGSNVDNWLTPVTGMEFSTSILGVPWTDPEYGYRAPVYENRGTMGFRVSFAPDGASMCSMNAPGQSGFIAPNGDASQHHGDQVKGYLNYQCTEKSLSGDVGENAITLYY